MELEQKIELYKLSKKENDFFSTYNNLYSLS